MLTYSTAMLFDTYYCTIKDFLSGFDDFIRINMFLWHFTKFILEK